jgi:hypothetical protein
MNVRLATSACLAFLLAAGCTAERGTAPETPPEPAPSFNQAGDNLCQFHIALNLATSYFPSALRTPAKNKIRVMIAAGARTPAAREAGFDVMAMIADVVHAGTGGAPADGSGLTNELIECMFQPADFPDVFPVDFTAALDPAQDGGYEVRGPTQDATPVLARGEFAFSGVAPQPDMTWADVLDERVLIVGRRAGPEAYDWSMIRPAATFDPPVVVGVCVESFGTFMLSEEHVGILAFVDPTYFLPCPNLVAAGTAPSPVGPLGRLSRLAMRWLGPSPLHAATLMPGGTGGLAGGLRSLFQPIDLTTVGQVALTFTAEPVSGIVNQPLSPVQVRALTGRGTPVAGVQVTLEAVFPATLEGTITLVTGPDGFATFTDVRIPQAGQTRLKAEGTVLGRPAIEVFSRKTEPFTVSSPD